jgi:NhaP-type Na+/H+ or K+/H+ antiporter
VAALAVATPVVAVAMPEYHPPVVNKAGCLSRTFNYIKGELQSSRLTKNCFPPSGEVATILTLLVVAIGLFVTARAVLGPIAGPGGTIFALIVLVIVALLGGLVIKGAGLALHNLCGLDIRLPPLLGMLIVGILLKNIPYNFGQFGRAECFDNGTAAGFVDSLNDLEAAQEEHMNFKRSIPEDENLLIFDIDFDAAAKEVHQRLARSAGGHGEVHDGVEESLEESCKPKYIGHDLDPMISVTLRSICLTVILLMAGLELDPVALWKLSAMVVRATFIPCFVEAFAAAALSHFILGFPWTIGLMLGFVLAAVSPAVIIPSLMNLSSRGYGVAKGIPTLVIAACSADDVVAISGFGIFLGITFASDDAPLTMLILHGPIEVVLGTSFGVFWGILAQWIPHKDNKNCVFYRWLILFSGGLIAVFGAHHIHYEGAGGLATIIMAFLASMEWRKEGWGDHNPVSKIFTKMWIILEPVIFALIGTEIQIDKIDPKTMGYGILVLVLALVIRMIGTFFAVSCGNLNFKEKIFMAFAWLPKATVQAALGK